MPRKRVGFLDINPGYSHNAFKHTAEDLISHAQKSLVGVDFDTMVGTGTSGCVVPIIARAMHKHWVLVRSVKSTHHEQMIAGELGKRWVFVDDIMASGRTEESVIYEIDTTCKDYDWETEYVGRYLYMHSISDAFYEPDDDKVFE